MSVVSHIDLRISEFIPKFLDAEELYPQLFASLVPNFDCVKFALIEVLELDRKISKAKTWVYFEKSQEESEHLVQEYFSMIDQLFSERTFSLSSADEFYFGDRVLFSRVDNPDIAPINCQNLRWMNPHQTNLRRDYQTRNAVDAVDVLDAYNEYVFKLSQTLLKPYPVSYVLLVPVALNHHNQESHQRKIGAAFLHFGLNIPLANNQFTEKRSSDLSTEKRFAQNVFQGINLYWHHWLTAESLYRQVEFANSANVAALSAEAAAKKADNLLQEFMDEQQRYADDVLPLVKDLEMQVNAIKEQVAPQPHIRAKGAFLSLKEIFNACFSETGPLHDPCGHTNLNALLQANQNQRIYRLVKNITENLLKTETFKGDRTALDIFLNPLIDLPENHANDPLAPHPALCLAKCISSKKIPFPWVPLALGFQEIEDAHWRHFLHLRGTQDEQSFSALDVFCTLKTLAKKLGLNNATMQMNECCTMTMTFQPIWEGGVAAQSLNRIREQMRNSDRGGTRTALTQLLNIGFKVQIKDEIFWLDKYRQDIEPNEICVNDDCVKFTLFTYHEKKPS